MVKMKAGIFDPYLDTIGGGERYTLTLAEYLANNDWQADVFWEDDLIKEKIEDRLNINLKRVNFVPRENNLLGRIIKERLYGLLFFLSDGSIPLMLGKKNILHFQVPFKNVTGKSFWNKFKLKRVHYIVCNSFFTKRFIDREFGIDSTVIYPPIEVERFKANKKENIILSVGRFSQLMQAKNQQILIQVFRKMIDSGVTGWRLILAGGTDIGGKDYFNKLNSISENYPIEFFENPNFSVLVGLYGRAKIFWSASGLGIDEEKEPERVEHFGITTVEAMAAGCVPLVVGKGGQGEIVEKEKNGFLWQGEEELEKLTFRLIGDEGLLRKIASQSIERSREFSKENFCRKFAKLISA